MKEYYKNKKVLITGGNGFIGNKLIEVLSKYNADISVVDLNNTNLIKYKKVKYINCNIENYSKIKNIIQNLSPEIVYHLAAFIDRNYNYGIIKKMIRVNLVGTVNLLESQKYNKNCQRIIIAGTCEEYGFQKEKYNENMKENPVTPYSFSKVCNSYLCRMLINNDDLPIIILRPSLAYGPGQNKNMFIPALINNLIENKRFEMSWGEQTRDFIYISDLINAYLKAGLNRNIYGEIINIGSGKSYKLKNVAKMIGFALQRNNLINMGKKSYRKAEIMDYRVDISKARKLLGWKPKISLGEGLSRTINNYLNEKR